MVTGEDKARGGRLALYEALAGTRLGVTPLPVVPDPIAAGKGSGGAVAIHFANERHTFEVRR